MLWNGLREFPGTPAKIFAGIVCELLYVVVILGGLVLGRAMPLDLVIALGSVVLAFNGVTTWQFAAQRKTDYGYVERQAQGPSPVSVEATTAEIKAPPMSGDAPSVAVQPLISALPTAVVPTERDASPRTVPPVDVMAIAGNPTHRDD